MLKLISKYIFGDSKSNSYPAFSVHCFGSGYGDGYSYGSGDGKNKGFGSGYGSGYSYGYGDGNPEYHGSDK